MLHFTVDVNIKKTVESHKQEKYSQEEIQALTKALSSGGRKVTVQGTEYELIPQRVQFVSPVKDLNELDIPLAPLRQEIARLMQSGILQMGLSDLLTIVRIAYHEQQELQET